ncbi:MAG: pantoate--beta-alanine ligase [Bacteroidota bacterium]|nr:pantoate--beta-alanine ligase [Bacteroidota bacterium]
MTTYSQILELRSTLNDYREKKKSIALVPTMGYLHDGHLSLIKKAKAENDIVVVSIFVNPTQFGPKEDFARYPRNIERDSELAKLSGCDILFIPSVEEMYPAGFSTYAVVENISTVLEGKFRPTHFKGVTTVVLKLLNIVQPQVAYFGQKDAQQCVVIRKMVTELNLHTEISIVPTLRESDGLAMSSRNVYLSPDERKNAVALNQSLRLAERLIHQGERNSETIINEMMKLIQSKNPTTIDYIEIVGTENLEKRTSIKSGDTILIPLAVRFGTTRLIDNTIITV